MNAYDEIVSAAKLLSIQERAKLMSELAIPERRKAVVKAVKVVTNKRSDDPYIKVELEPANAAWLTVRQVAPLLAAVGRARGLKPIRREEDPEIDARRRRDDEAERMAAMLEAAGIDPNRGFDEADLSNFLVGASVVVIEKLTPDGIDVKLVLDQDAVAAVATPTSST